MEEMGVDTEGTRRTSDSHQELKRQDGSSLRASQHGHQELLISDSWPPKLWEDEFLLCESPCPW